MMYILLLFLISYVVYWILVDFAFKKKDNQVHNNAANAYPYCSIIICAHNEEKNIKRCLDSILMQKSIEYAEIIVVDDASTDNTLAIAHSILNSHKVPFQIISNDQKIGKKRSIEKALRLCHVRSEWIILRDADTYTTSHEWFVELLKKMTPNTDLILAPIILDIHHPTIIQYLQYMENLALMHLTLGSLHLNTPILANAANMAFRKSSFEKISPYSDNYDIPSGDDIFLLIKLHRHNGTISSAFNHESIVLTYPHSNLSKLFQQRLRWLSKSTYIKSPFNTLSMLIISLANIMFIPALFFSFKLAILFFCIKSIIDFKILHSVVKKLNIPLFPLVYFFIAELLYIPYVCALIFHFLIFKRKFNDRRTFTTERY